MLIAVELKATATGFPYNQALQNHCKTLTLDLCPGAHAMSCRTSFAPVRGRDVLFWQGELSQDGVHSIARSQSSDHARHNVYKPARCKNSSIAGVSCWAAQPSHGRSNLDRHCKSKFGSLSHPRQYMTASGYSWLATLS